MELKSVRGMRDLIGQDALLQETIEEKFRRVFSSYGYLPLYTPAVEYYNLFKTKGTVGEAIRDEIYCFRDKSERELALRFEFTSSLARVAVTNQLKLPFKRYQIGEVYRYDRPQAKRYRAFYQADIDILGVKGLNAEIELIQVIRDCFCSLNLEPKIVFNSRKLLNEVLKKYVTQEKIVEAMRLIDKLDKVSPKEIKLALKEKGVDASVIDLIQKNSLEEISKVVGEKSIGLSEVREFEELCEKNKLDFVEFDFGLARGFDYYTGIVFEVKLGSGPSVGGGGRFDNLIEGFGGVSTPAVGVGLGVSRILDYLKEKQVSVSLDGFFLCGVGVEGNKLVGLSEKIRGMGVFNEVDLLGRGLSKNISFAESKGYKFVGIIGENELRENKVSIKNILSGEQTLVSVSEKELKKFFEGNK